MAGKIKRNDPCPCGSGKKYKNCCMARDRAAQAERVAWARAAQDIRWTLIDFARRRIRHPYAQEGDADKVRPLDADQVRPLDEDVATALELFWQGRYTADTIHLMSEDESLRFFDWFAHDYVLSGSCEHVRQKRLIEVYRDEVGDTLNEKEAAILDGWIDSLPGSAFILERVDAEQGTIVIRDIFLSRPGTGPDGLLTVHDAAAARHGQVGQILLARPLPELDPTLSGMEERVRLSGATVVLPASEEEGIRAFIADKVHPGERRSPEAMARFLRDWAYLLTHYALEWAEREERPPIAAQDPDVRRRGGRSLQKLIKWKQQRTHVR